MWARTAARKGFAALIMVRVATLPDLRPSSDAAQPTKGENPIMANRPALRIVKNVVNSDRLNKQEAAKENISVSTT